MTWPTAEARSLTLTLLKSTLPIDLILLFSLEIQVSVTHKTSIGIKYSAEPGNNLKTIPSQTGVHNQAVDFSLTKVRSIFN